MDSRVVALGVGVACLFALWGVAGSVQAPPTPAGVEYDVVAPSPSFELGERSVSGGAAEALGLPEGALSSESPIGPIGLVVVFGLWGLVALWMMGLTASLLFVLATTVLYGLYLFSSFGAMDVTGGSVVQSTLSLEDQLVLALYVVAQIGVAAYFVLPDDSPLHAKTDALLAALRSRFWSLPGRVDDLRSRFRARNDVYDAWLTVARLADRDVNSYTSREIADAAMDVGLPGEEVEALRRLFEATRYGTSDPDEDQRRRARQIIERIEGSR